MGFLTTGKRLNRHLSLSMLLEYVFLLLRTSPHSHSIITLSSAPLVFIQRAPSSLSSQFTVDQWLPAWAHLLSKHDAHSLYCTNTQALLFWPRCTISHRYIDGDLIAIVFVLSLQSTLFFCLCVPVCFHSSSASGVYRKDSDTICHHNLLCLGPAALGLCRGLCGCLL